MDSCREEMENSNAHESVVHMDQWGGKGIQERVTAKLGDCGEKTRLNSSLNETHSHRLQEGEW